MMAGFPNRGGGTNPLPDWYASKSRAELRAIAYEQGVPISRLARNARDLAWGVSSTSDAPEEVLRGPLSLRLRLWWMRLWLPGRTWKRRNRLLLLSLSLSLVIDGGIGLVNGNLWWFVLLIIVGNVLIIMTITRSWRADRDGD